MQRVCAITTLGLIGFVSFFVGTIAAQQPFGPRQAALPQQQQQPQPNPQANAPWQLTPEEQKHVDQVLQFWEFNSAKIQRYRCDVDRWEYDPQNFHPTEAERYAKGQILYAQPDKGLFEINEVQQGSKTPEGKVIYTKQGESAFEKWICDGKTIFEFDYRNQRLIERALPPNMQGQAIINGPLPFLFGAKANEIKARYWVREIANGDNKFWLKIVPKFQADAADFDHIQIVIPGNNEFLPEAMLLFHRGGTKTTYQFGNRETNWLEVEKLKFWQNAFFNPKTPAGWKRFQEPFGQQPAAPPPVNDPQRQAQRFVPPRAIR